MKLLHKIFGLSLLSIAFVACEEEYTPDQTNLEPDYVVEGIIEAGSESNPVYVLLTKTLPFYSEIGPQELSNIYVHDAVVKVIEGPNTFTLTELCFSQLPDDLKKLVAESFGWNADSLAVDICVYIDLARNIKPEIGKTYTLDISVDGKNITSVTTIPELIPIDSIYWGDIPGEKKDSFAQLFCYINDLAGKKDFYRYFTASQNTAFVSPENSITDDVFFDGQYFKFTLAKAEPFGAEFDPERYGYWVRGDTVTIKWCNIPEEHFQFWNTLEVSRQRQGPFGSYVRIDGNINGGLGIWGAYACDYYHYIVPKR